MAELNTDDIAAVFMAAVKIIKKIKCVEKIKTNQMTTEMITKNLPLIKDNLLEFQQNIARLPKISTKSDTNTSALIHGLNRLADLDYQFTENEIDERIKKIKLQLDKLSNNCNQDNSLTNAIDMINTISDNIETINVTNSDEIS